MNEKIADLIEQSDEQLIQQIIDVQEGAIGLEEKHFDVEPSAEALKRFQAGLDKLCFAECEPVPSRHAHKVRKFIILAALIAVLLCIAVTAFHLNLLNWVERLQDGASTFTVEADPEDIIRSWDDANIPSAIPTGFILHAAISGTSAKIIEYVNTAGDKLTFYLYNADANFSLDTEDVSVELAQIETGMYFYEKELQSTLYWFSNDRAYSIDFNANAVSLDAVVQMAKSLRPVS